MPRDREPSNYFERQATRIWGGLALAQGEAARALAIAALQPYAHGAYLNCLGDEGQERVHSAYGSNYERLVALKNKYDPTNLFRLTQNIRLRV